MSEFRAAQDVMGSIDDILQIPDEVFSTSMGRSMLDAMAAQIDVAGLAKTQRDEFLRQGMSYEQVIMACHNMASEVEDLISSIEDMEDVIAEKKVFFKQIFEKFFQMPDLILKDYPRYDATIPIQLTHPSAKYPTYAHDGDDGADVYVVEDTIIYPGETKKIPLGFKMAIPRGWSVSTRPRSGLSLTTKLRMANAPGTIDANYLGEAGLVMENISVNPDEIIKLSAGDRVAQFVLERAYKAEYVPTDDVNKHTSESRVNANGEHGYGSTGLV